MIDRTHLTKKQVEFLDIADKKIAEGLDDANNGRLHSIDEVKITLKEKIRNNNNVNTKQGLGVMM